MKLYKFFSVGLVCLGLSIVKADNLPQIKLTNSQSSSMDGAPSLNIEDPFYRPQIVGGRDALRDEFPEFVQLYLDTQNGFIVPWCGATLLTGKKVLTAAHCTSGYSASRFYALPGFYSFNDVFDFSDLFKVSDIVEHPRYGELAPFDNDVAILTLDQKSDAPKATLYARYTDLTDQRATIVGSGILSEGGITTQTLQKVNVPIISDNICEQTYGADFSDNMMCAGIKPGGKDSCDGDSGGPLLVKHEGKRIQAGIVSWGTGCARPEFYGVYTRLSEVLPFVSTYVPFATIITGGSNKKAISGIVNYLLDNDSDEKPVVSEINEIADQQ